MWLSVNISSRRPRLRSFFFLYSTPLSHTLIVAIDANSVVAVRAKWHWNDSRISQRFIKHLQSITLLCMESLIPAHTSCLCRYERHTNTGRMHRSILKKRFLSNEISYFLLLFFFVPPLERLQCSHKLWSHNQQETQLKAINCINILTKTSWENELRRESNSLNSVYLNT